MSHGKYMARGVALGGLAGAGLGYVRAPNKTKAEKENRKYHALRGGLLGGALGVYVGLGTAAYKHKGFVRRYNRSSSFGANRPTPHYKESFSHFGMTGGETTKAEAIRKFRDKAMKYHPDRPGGSDAKMRDLNAHWENIKNSDWFDKLASVGFVAGFSRISF